MSTVTVTWLHRYSRVPLSRQLHGGIAWPAAKQFSSSVIVAMMARRGDWALLYPAGVHFPQLHCERTRYLRILLPWLSLLQYCLSGLTFLPMCLPFVLRFARCKPGWCCVCTSTNLLYIIPDSGGCVKGKAGNNPDPFLDSVWPRAVWILSYVQHKGVAAQPRGMAVPSDDRLGDE